MKAQLLYAALGAVQARDFTRADIVALYTRELPYLGAIRCFTCDAEADNWECNTKSPDVFCQPGEEFCFTHHAFETNTTDSRRVTKSCKSQLACQNEALGCEVDLATGMTVCRECCAGEICNLSLPRNDTTVLALAHLFNPAQWPILSMLLLMMALML